MKIITKVLNIYSNRTYISWHNSRCIPRLVTYQTLILLILIMLFIYEIYEHVNHIHLVHFHHLYMNVIQIILCCYQDQLNLENIQHKYLPLIMIYFHPNVDTLFLYRLFHVIFLRKIYLIFLFLDALAQKQSFLVFPHSVKPRILT